MIIDVHHHYLPRDYFENIAQLLPADIEPVWREGRIAGKDRTTGQLFLPFLDPTRWYDAELQLRELDAAGIDHAILSAACYQDWMTIDAARVINDGMAAVAARYPDRFTGMISVPPDGGEQMVAEIRRGQALGLRAVNITTTHRNRYPDHSDFALLFQTAADLGLPVYIHPSWRTPLPNMERWDLERAVGKPTDLNLSVANLMFSGTFNSLPQLRVLCAHLGGSLPVTLRRLFHGQPGWLGVPDFDYPRLLKRLYVDTAPGMWHSPVEITAAARIIGTSQLLLGSDYPLSNDPAEVLRLAVRNVREADLADEEKRLIFAGNAISLFGLDRLPDSSTVAAGISGQLDGLDGEA